MSNSIVTKNFRLQPFPIKEEANAASRPKKSNKANHADCIPRQNV